MSTLSIECVFQMSTLSIHMNTVAAHYFRGPVYAHMKIQSIG